MKKILYAALGLSIFIFGGSQLLTQAASLPNGNFGVGSGCSWEFNPADGSFVVDVDQAYTTCTLENDSKYAWAKNIKKKNKKCLTYIYNKAKN